MKPTTTPTEPALPLVNGCCCGIDVHKDTVVACIRTTGADGLAARCVTSVAMESTGVYWKPVWNLLEGRATADGEPIGLMLVNARHMRNVPAIEKGDIPIPLPCSLPCGVV